MQNPHRHPRPSPILAVALLFLLPTPGLTPWSSASNRGFSVDQNRIEDLRVGPFYKGGTRVRSSFLGMSFVVPKDWRVRQPTGSPVLHLDSARKPGIGVMLLIDSTTPEELESRLEEPQAFEEAYVLDPSGPVERSGPRFSAAYLRGDQVGRAVAVLGPASRAVIYLLAGPEGEARYYEGLLSKLADSTQFLTREKAERLQRWYQHIAGKMLRNETASVPPALREWHFCENGRFLHVFRPFTVHPDEPGAAGFEEYGTWRVDVESREATLVVTPQHALPRRHALHRDERYTYLGDEPFSLEPSDQCL